MGKVKVLKEEELVGGTSTTPIYPVTSTSAVYKADNTSLDEELKNINNMADLSKVVDYLDTVAYSKKQLVRWNGAVYYSKKDNNTDNPSTSNWGLWSGTPIVQELGDDQHKVISQAGIKKAITATANDIKKIIPLYFKKEYSTSSSKWETPFTFPYTVPKGSYFLIKISSETILRRVVCNINNTFASESAVFDRTINSQYFEMFFTSSAEVQSITLFTSSSVSSYNIEVSIDIFTNNVINTLKTDINTLKTDTGDLKSATKTAITSTLILQSNCFISNPSCTDFSRLDKTYKSPYYNSDIPYKFGYAAIKYIKFKGFDSSIPRTLFFCWGADASTSGKIGISEYQNGAWREKLRISVSPNDFPAYDGLVYVKYTYSSTQEIELLIDMSMSTARGTSGGLLTPLTITPELIFSPNCYEQLAGGTVTKDEFNALDARVKVSEGQVPNVTKLSPNAKLPVFSFEFDDLGKNDEEVASLFESYGLRCGFAFIANESNIKNKALTYLNLQRKGHSILNHSVDGKVFNAANYTYNSAYETILLAQKRLINSGFIVNGWVSPSSSLDSEFLPIIKQFFAYASTYQDAGSNGRRANPCNTTRQSIESIPIATVKANIDTAIQNDKIMTFYGHSNSFGTTYSTEMWGLDKIKEVIEYVLDKQSRGLCRVLSPDEARAYYFNL